MEQNEAVLILIYLHDYRDPDLFEYTTVPKDVAYIVQEYVRLHSNSLVTLDNILDSLSLKEFSVEISENEETVNAVVLLESHGVYTRSCRLLDTLMGSIFDRVCGRKLAKDMVSSTSTKLQYELIRTCSNYLFEDLTQN